MVTVSNAPSMKDMRPIYIVMADYGGAWAWLKDDGQIDRYGVGGNIAMAGFGGWGSDAHPIPKELDDEFGAWQWLFDSNYIGDAPAAIAFPWEQFNAQGMALCRKLKAVLGDDVRVCYERAFEQAGYTEEPGECDIRCEFLADGNVKAWVLKSRDEFRGHVPN